MKLLIVSSDGGWAGRLSKGLWRACSHADYARTGDEAYDYTRTYDYDVVLVDVGLSGEMPAEKLLRTLRANGNRTPIAMWALNPDNGEEIRLLDLGADAYMGGELHVPVLMARVRALVRRPNGHVQSTLTVGDLRLNMDLRTVWVKETPVALTCKEYRVLEALALRVEMPMSRAVLLDKIGNGGDTPAEGIITRFVCNIRKRIRAAGGDPACVATYLGGYVLRATSC